jgi:gamma-glutamylcyclotransferase (GGCT)/AIG2-like uncharacterized protein YtfP
MKDNMTRLFVYGSLRSDFQLPVFQYISKCFALEGEAKVRGFLYDLGDYPAAIPTSDEAFITGELYKAKNDSDFLYAIKQLDAYEEVNSTDFTTSLFSRKIAEVIFHHTIVNAWIYWYNRDLRNKTLIPSGDIMNVMHLKNKL